MIKVYRVILLGHDSKWTALRGRKKRNSPEMEDVGKFSWSK